MRLLLYKSLRSVMCLNWQFDLKAFFIFSDPRGTGWHVGIFAGSKFDCA